MLNRYIFEAIIIAMNDFSDELKMIWMWPGHDFRCRLCEKEKTYGNLCIWPKGGGYNSKRIISVCRDCWSLITEIHYENYELSEPFTNPLEGLASITYQSLKDKIDETFGKVSDK